MVDNNQPLWLLRAMNLSEYLSDHGLSPAKFAERIGVTDESIRRYAHGQRYPRPEIMRRIVATTDGAVGPEDFLDAHADEGEAA